MTTYALDPESRSVLAVWGAGVGHRARVRFSLSDFRDLGQAARSYWCW